MKPTSMKDPFKSKMVEKMRNRIEELEQKVSETEQNLAEMAFLDDYQEKLAGLKTINQKIRDMIEFYANLEGCD